MATNEFIPKAILNEETLKRAELVSTESDATELIVPVHQPIKWACIINEGLISNDWLVNTDSKNVEDITGWIPIIATKAIDNGMNIKTNHSGMNKKFLLQSNKISELVFETK